MNSGVRLHHRNRGFTLIEVLAALVIVALGMLGVIEAVSQTASNSSYLRDKTLAHWIAMNQMTTVRLAPQPPKLDKSSDQVEMAGRHWRWTMNVVKTPVDSVRWIDITVRPEDANEKSSLASLTGFYGTALAQPGTTIVLWQGDLQSSAGAGNGDDKEDDNKKEQPPPKTPPTPPPTPPPTVEPDPGEPTDPPIEPTPEPTE